MFGGGATSLVAAMDALWIEPNWLRVTEHDVPVEKLPKMLDGYRIAQVTDAHLRHLGTVEERIIQEIRSRDVGLVVLTGDIIDNPWALPLLDEFCHNLQGAHPTVLATLGNWEHRAHIPIRTLEQKYRSHGIRLLVNESELVDEAICVAGTDDSTGGRMSLQKTMSTFTAAAVGLFLTHSPGVLDRVPAAVGQFNLTLAGHTHGGQGRIGPFAPMRPPGSGRFISGWYQVPIGRAYVSCGTGTSVIRARFDCRPELPIFSLRRSAD
jgi:predicted MPP superfamily phosphohydrolase